MGTLQSAGLTNVGRVRSNNEDAFLVASPLCMVADGMGGAAAGEVASHLAIETISHDLKGISYTTDQKVEKKVRAAFKHADDEIKHLMKKNTQYLGMGTTLVMAIPFGERIFIANVGDSRAYLITSPDAGNPARTAGSSSAAASTGIMPAIGEGSMIEAPAMGAITRLTRDHSVVMEMVAAGIITEDLIRTHPLRNRITRALGSFGNSEPDFFWFDMHTGDTYLLCSDGLWEMVHEDLILALVKSSSELEELNTRLVRAANNSGGVDNITVVTIRVG